MPTEWDNYSLNRIYACTDTPFDISVERTKGGKLAVRVTKNGKVVVSKKVKPGETFSVKM